MGLSIKNYVGMSKQVRRLITSIRFPLRLILAATIVLIFALEAVQLVRYILSSRYVKNALFETILDWMKISSNKNWQTNELLHTVFHIIGFLFLLISLQRTIIGLGAVEHTDGSRATVYVFFSLAASLLLFDQPLLGWLNLLALLCALLYVFGRPIERHLADLEHQVTTSRPAGPSKDGCMHRLGRCLVSAHLPSRLLLSVAIFLVFFHEAAALMYYIFGSLDIKNALLDLIIQNLTPSDANKLPGPKEQLHVYLHITAVVMLVVSMFRASIGFFAIEEKSNLASCLLTCLYLLLTLLMLICGLHVSLIFNTVALFCSLFYTLTLWAIMFQDWRKTEQRLVEEQEEEEMVEVEVENGHADR